MSGQLQGVRKSWTPDGISDRMIVGRKDGHEPVTLIGYAASARSTRIRATARRPRRRGLAKVFEDRASGARSDRPGLRQALDYVREGDVLVVWKLIGSGARSRI